MVDKFNPITPDPLRGRPLQGDASWGKRLQRLKKNGDDTAIRKFSQDFEALFVQRMMKEMRKSIPKSGLMGEGLSMEWFEEMFDQAVAKEISEGEGVGMAKVIYEQLTRAPGGDRPGRPGSSQQPPAGPAEGPEKLKNASGQIPGQEPKDEGAIDE